MNRRNGRYSDVVDGRIPSDGASTETRFFPSTSEKLSARRIKNFTPIVVALIVLLSVQVVNVFRGGISFGHGVELDPASSINAMFAGEPSVLISDELRFGMRELIHDGLRQSHMAEVLVAKQELCIKAANSRASSNSALRNAIEDHVLPGLERHLNSLQSAIHQQQTLKAKWQAIDAKGWAIPRVEVETMLSDGRHLIREMRLIEESQQRAIDLMKVLDGDPFANLIPGLEPCSDDRWDLSRDPDEIFASIPRLCGIARSGRLNALIKANHPYWNHKRHHALLLKVPDERDLEDSLRVFFSCPFANHSDEMIRWKANCVRYWASEGRAGQGSVFQFAVDVLYEHDSKAATESDRRAAKVSDLFVGLILELLGKSSYSLIDDEFLVQLNRLENVLWATESEGN